MDAPSKLRVLRRKPVVFAVAGLALILAIALVARVAARYTGPVPDVVVALAIGVLLRNALALPATIAPGIKATLFYGLRTAIILLGAALSAQAVIRTGGATLILVVTLVVTAMGLGIGAARLFKLKSPIGTLIGAGTAICGASARNLVTNSASRGRPNSFPPASIASVIPSVHATSKSSLPSANTPLVYS